MKGPYGVRECPRCGKTVCVTKGGGLRQHRNADRNPGAAWECPWWKPAPPAPEPRDKWQDIGTSNALMAIDQWDTGNTEGRSAFDFFHSYEENTGASVVEAKGDGDNRMTALWTFWEVIEEKTSGDLHESARSCLAPKVYAPERR